MLFPRGSGAKLQIARPDAKYAKLTRQSEYHVAKACEQMKSKRWVAQPACSAKVTFATKLSKRQKYENPSSRRD